MFSMTAQLPTTVPVERAPELLDPAALFAVDDAGALARHLRAMLADPTALAAAGITARRVAESSLSLANFHSAVAATLQQSLAVRQR